ncbi:glycosyltransferase, group 1 family protein [Acinetobacter baumannii OIFC0162]|uniref:glycosyltransferase family 4 protein n=1 Tax=Acinetobacter TaxID=469 RepID=UPI00028F1C9C|nr:glycosyltransferase family 4 protein [Acinetobacter baumannii]AJB68686.1 hypothetical protein RU84_17985 [Acinetobacter baumannii]EKK11552.1 glycosyltransferase, group 1 family protein [Acinetobacter baumannii OIFC0162]MCY0273444.1 glycosyltransferase family 4 protein [Acinetobacter baumannii]
MKILFFINSLKYKSGTERVACVLANLFVEKMNCDISIINRDTDFSSVAYPLNDKVKVYKVSGSYSNFFLDSGKLLNSIQPDFIISHNMGKLSLLLTFLSRGHAKLISLEHVAFSVRPKLVRLFSNILYKRIDQVVVLTEQDKKSYSSFHKNIIKINNISPYDLDENHIYNTNSKDIIAVGRLTYQKNYESLLESWEIISNKSPEWNLKIYGTGENLDDLTKIITERKLKNVKLMGAASNIDEIYKKAAFFVMSSRFEGLPMVLIEAQTFGLPIVSYDCPHGPSEVIDHEENGLLVENQNSEALAKAIQRLIDQPEVRLEYSKSAKKSAQRFTTTSILNEWKNLVGCL